MRHPSLAFVLIVAAAGLACSFEPNVPSARVLCRGVSDCPKGFTCESVPAAASPGTSVCCQQPGCARNLTADDLRRLNNAADGGGGTRADGAGGTRADGGGSARPEGGVGPGPDVVGNPPTDGGVGPGADSGANPGNDAGGGVRLDGGGSPGTDAGGGVRLDGGSAPNCGNGRVDPGETCDPPSECPTACPPQGCDRFRLQGTAAACTAQCVRTGSETMCRNGDVCCPPGCAGRDMDCSPVCGNSVVEAGEQCDPPAACQAALDGCSSDASNIRTPMGRVQDCTFRCVASRRPCSVTMDGSCPATCQPCVAACGALQDLDCRLGGGAACVHPNQCNGTCTDGRCCTQTCAACQSCTGAGGTCAPLPALSEDNVPAGACAGSNSCDGTAAGAAACKLDDGQACGSDGQCASGVCGAFFGDADGDGQVGAVPATRVCGKTAPPGLQATAGPDCCDRDPGTKREDMLASFFFVPNACGNFDYDCANGEQPENQTEQLCDLVLCRSGWAPNAVPACGQTGEFTECVRHNIGNTTFCDQGPAKPRTQGCR